MAAWTVMAASKLSSSKGSAHASPTRKVVLSSRPVQRESSVAAAAERRREIDPGDRAADSPRPVCVPLRRGQSRCRAPRCSRRSPCSRQEQASLPFPGCGTRRPPRAPQWSPTSDRSLRLAARPRSTRPAHRSRSSGWRRPGSSRPSPRARHHHPTNRATLRARPPERGTPSVSNPCLSEVCGRARATVDQRPGPSRPGAAGSPGYSVVALEPSASSRPSRGPFMNMWRWCIWVKSTGMFGLRICTRSNAKPLGYACTLSR